jgi:hypothetical protein
MLNACKEQGYWVCEVQNMCQRFKLKRTWRLLEALPTQVGNTTLVKSAYRPWLAKCGWLQQNF